MNKSLYRSHLGTLVDELLSHIRSRPLHWYAGEAAAPIVVVSDAPPPPSVEAMLRMLNNIAAKKLSPRHLQTLARLLLGDSEKEIAYRIKISQHTVHVYVKAIYRTFDVESRGELLARFVPPEIVIAANCYRKEPYKPTPKEIKEKAAELRAPVESNGHAAANGENGSRKR